MAADKANPASRARLARILREVERLQPLPASLARLMRALDDPATTPGMMVDWLSLDQALTAELLRLANSAMLDYIPPCRSVSDAIMRLGFNRIKTMILGVHASPLLARNLRGYRLTADELWHHSVNTASLARHVAGALRYESPDEAYVAGLLHDLGKSVLDQHVAADYLEVVELMRREKLRLWQAEERLFGADHGYVGGQMAMQWHFAPSLVDAIRCHHWPTFSTAAPRLAAIVNLADAWAHCRADQQLRLGDGLVHPEALRLLDLDQARWDRLQASLPKTSAEGLPRPVAV